MGLTIYKIPITWCNKGKYSLHWLLSWENFIAESQ